MSSISAIASGLSALSYLQPSSNAPQQVGGGDSDCVFHGNWTLSPQQTGQSERSDAGVVFYS